MVILEADKIARFFSIGNTPSLALAEQSLAVQAGEFLVLTGPSGSGKSTLLNLLSGLDRPSHGEVRYRGQSLAAMGHEEIARLRNLSFGFIFQTPHLLPDRTVVENVQLPFHYGPTETQAAIEGRCLELLAYVGMADLASRYPDTLSGGEMQRVVFARALARRPEIIFADEPTGSLDAGNSRRILELLREQTEQGRSVIMATHDADGIAYATRVIRLEKLQIGGWA
ncbi:MAG: ABC transporter ATP-binding protein [Desulforhopalus sp.]|nr:ABC transporter ATP-binding protein [Desulforhopalus sp.]